MRKLIFRGFSIEPELQNIQGRKTEEGGEIYSRYTHNIKVTANFCGNIISYIHNICSKPDSLEAVNTGQHVKDG